MTVPGLNSAGVDAGRAGVVPDSRALLADSRTGSSGGAGFARVAALGDAVKAHTGASEVRVISVLDGGDVPEGHVAVLYTVPSNWRVDKLHVALVREGDGGPQALGSRFVSDVRRGYAPAHWERGLNLAQVNKQTNGDAVKAAVRDLAGAHVQASGNGSHSGNGRVGVQGGAGGTVPTEHGNPGGVNVLGNNIVENPGNRPNPGNGGIEENPDNRPNPGNDGLIAREVGNGRNRGNTNGSTAPRVRSSPDSTADNTAVPFVFFNASGLELTAGNIRALRESAGIAKQDQQSLTVVGRTQGGEGPDQPLLFVVTDRGGKSHLFIGKAVEGASARHLHSHDGDYNVEALQRLNLKDTLVPANVRKLEGFGNVAEVGLVDALSGGNYRKSGVETLVFYEKYVNPESGEDIWVVFAASPHNNRINNRVLVGVSTTRPQIADFNHTGDNPLAEGLENAFLQLHHVDNIAQSGKALHVDALKDESGIRNLIGGVADYLIGIGTSVVSAPEWVLDNLHGSTRHMWNILKIPLNAILPGSPLGGDATNRFVLDKTREITETNDTRAAVEGWRDQLFEQYSVNPESGAFTAGKVLAIAAGLWLGRGSANRTGGAGSATATQASGRTILQDIPQLGAAGGALATTQNQAALTGFLATAATTGITAQQAGTLLNAALHGKPLPADPALASLLANHDGAGLVALVNVYGSEGLRALAASDPQAYQSMLGDVIALVANNPGNQTAKNALNLMLLHMPKDASAASVLEMLKKAGVHSSITQQTAQILENANLQGMMGGGGGQDIDTSQRITQAIRQNPSSPITVGTNRNANIQITAAEAGRENQTFEIIPQYQSASSFGAYGLSRPLEIRSQGESSDIEVLRLAHAGDAFDLTSRDGYPLVYARSFVKLGNLWVYIPPDQFSINSALNNLSGRNISNSISLVDPAALSGEQKTYFLNHIALAADAAANVAINNGTVVPDPQFAVKAWSAGASGKFAIYAQNLSVQRLPLVTEGLLEQTISLNQHIISLIEKDGLTPQLQTMLASYENVLRGSNFRNRVSGPIFNDPSNPVSVVEDLQKLDVAYQAMLPISRKAEIVHGVLRQFGLENLSLAAVDQLYSDSPPSIETILRETFRNSDLEVSTQSPLAGTDYQRNAAGAQITIRPDPVKRAKLDAWQNSVSNAYDINVALSTDQELRVVAFYYFAAPELYQQGLLDGVVTNVRTFHEADLNSRQGTSHMRQLNDLHAELREKEITEVGEGESGPE